MANIVGNDYKFDKFAGAECIVNASNPNSRLFYFDDSKSGKISKFACAIGTKVFKSDQTKTINVIIKSQFKYNLDPITVPEGSIRDFLKSETANVTVTQEIKDQAIEKTIARIREAVETGVPDIFLELRTLKYSLEPERSMPNMPIRPMPHMYPETHSYGPGPYRPTLDRIIPPAPPRPPIDTPKKGLVSEATVRANFVAGTLPAATATYKGGSKIEFTMDGQKVALPRTLYQMFFIYFHLKEFKSDIDKNPKYPLYQTAVYTVGGRDNERTRRLVDEAAKITDANVRREIVNYLNSHHVNCSNIQWKDVDSFLNAFFADFDNYTNVRPSVYCMGQDGITRLYKKLDLNNVTVQVKTKEILKKIVAMEWTAPAGTYHFYRTHSILNETLCNETGTVNVMQFGTSPLAGLFACNGKPPFIDFKEKGEEFYCLELTEKEANNYLFIHEHLGLSPLMGMFIEDAFANPIFKPKIDDEHPLPPEYLKLQMGYYYLNSPLAKDKTYADFNEEISQLFEKRLRVIATNTNRLNDI